MKCEWLILHLLFKTSLVGNSLYTIMKFPLVNQLYLIIQDLNFKCSELIISAYDITDTECLSLRLRAGFSQYSEKWKTRSGVREITERFEWSG